MKVLRIIVIALLGIATVGGIGWALGFLAHQSPPPSLGSATTSEYVPVTSMEFGDPQNVDVEVTASSTQAVVVNAAGTITASSCAVGGEVASGSSTLSIDGIPITNLATEVPLWRDLAVGDKGSDVRAVQAELSRLGYEVSQDGVLGTETLSAIARLRGDDTRPEALSRAVFVWLPSAQATVSECTATRGARIEVAGVAFDVESSGPTVQIGNLAPEALAGDRQLSIDGASYPIDATGRISDPARSRELLSSAAYREVEKEEGTAHLTGVATLLTPVSVSSVPPSAVVTDASGSTCVIADGRPEAITVVGSQLGQSFVTFSGAVPSRVAVAPRKDSSCP